MKWQLDMKYVPKASNAGKMPDRFFQYTVIDEASRERFIYPFREQSSYSTVQFVKMAIRHFGHQPQTIQTDNLCRLYKGECLWKKEPHYWRAARQ